MIEKNGKWVTLENGVHIFIKEGQTLEDAIKEKEQEQKDYDNLSAREYGQKYAKTEKPKTNEKPTLLKGLVFKLKDKITENKFTDFIDEDYAKLDDDTYIYFWNNGNMHQDTENKIASKYKIDNAEYFATSLNYAGELDVYDFDRLRAYKKYSSEIEDKAKKLFEVNRTNRRK